MWSVRPAAVSAIARYSELADAVSLSLGGGQSGGSLLTGRLPFVGHAMAASKT
jgi:hypothetical protein